MPKGQRQQIVIPVLSHMNTALRISVTQGTGVDSIEIHNQILSGAGSYLVDVTPTDGNVRLNILRINAPLYDDPFTSVVTFSAPSRSGLQYESRSELAQVCPTPTDPYRFGFNGQQKDNEYAGLGNHNTALFWEYDTRVAKRWNVDPVVREWESPYATFGGNPVLYFDSNGDDFTDKNGNNVKAGDGIVATSDGMRITNTNNNRNWDYGTWNAESNSYDMQFYDKRNGLSASDVLDGGDIGLASQMSALSAGSVTRKAAARAANEGSYIRNVVESDGWGTI